MGNGNYLAQDQTPVRRQKSWSLIPNPRLFLGACVSLLNDYCFLKWLKYHSTVCVTQGHWSILSDYGELQKKKKKIYCKWKIMFHSSFTCACGKKPTFFSFPRTMLHRSYNSLISKPISVLPAKRTAETDSIEAIGSSLFGAKWWHQLFVSLSKLFSYSLIQLPPNITTGAAARHASFLVHCLLRRQ